jgi:hypothetical protein
VIEILEVKSQNHLYKSIRTLQKEKREFAVLYYSDWDTQSSFILKSILKQKKALQAEAKNGINLIENPYTVLLVDSFETPELFSAWEKTLPCTSVPTCYFYINDRKLREYKIYQEVLPSRILEGLNIFE